MTKPDWLRDAVVQRLQSNFLSATPNLKPWDPPCQLVEIREVAGSKDDVDLIFDCKLRGERTIRAKVARLTEEIFAPWLWDRLEYLE